MSRAKIQEFLKSPAFAVVGASASREKYGNKVLRCYQAQGLDVTPVNPTTPVIEGLEAVKDVTALPDKVKSISFVTPPAASTSIMRQIVERGVVRNVWFQPGAESPEAVEAASEAGLNVIADGSCILVHFGFEH